MPTVRGKALDAAPISKLVRTGHRGRAVRLPLSFRDRRPSGTDHPREVVEAALARVIDNRTEAAYARSDVPRRRARTVFPLRRAMAVRMLTYSGLLYQRLVAEGVLGSSCTREHG